MLLHIRPRLFSRVQLPASIVGIEIQPFNICLAGNQEITARRAYPNKRYLVASRRKGQRATDGILIEAPDDIAEFHCTTTWLLCGVLLTHQVKYTLIDHDFPGASDDMTLWYKHTAEIGGGNWPNRWPETMRSKAPLNTEPVMEVEPGETLRYSTHDTLAHDWIIRRQQDFAMPTLEPERILNSKLNDRIPAREDAFIPGYVSPAYKPLKSCEYCAAVILGDRPCPCRSTDFSASSVALGDEDVPF